MAMRRLFFLERKLAANPKLKEMYTAFMQEYLYLNHMSPVDPGAEDDDSPAYYIPHVGVSKESSLTTKLRVVFNASSKTTTNISSNEILCVGPTIQFTLFEILLRFREYPVALTADVTKIYRQRIEPSQRRLQRILWREDPEQPVNTYELNSNTYGTASAPFLATRSLNESAMRSKAKFPVTASLIFKSFYVDDFLGGARDRPSAIKLKEELEEILSPYGFDLRKWAASNPNVFKDRISHAEPFYFNDSDDQKVLGVGWNPTRDHFFFKALPLSNLQFHVSSFTKRTVLSEISKLFDPLGLVSPLVVRAKFLLQAISLEKIKNWDDKVSPENSAEWANLRIGFQSLSPIEIPRHLSTFPGDKTLTFHGFSDASKRGFGACVYVTSQILTSRLVCSKSRVAPLKPQTLPRLELAAALLLSELMSKVLISMQFKPLRVFLRSDSTVSLDWISKDPHSWQIFVANRVQKIQHLTADINASWHHIPTKLNPADLISREVSAKKLQTSTFWWNGPEFLLQDETSWPQPPVTIPSMMEIPEARKEMVLCTAVLKPPDELQYLLHRFSSLRKIIRILAYTIRFTNNCRANLSAKHGQTTLKKEDSLVSRKIGILSTTELDKSLNVLVRTVQKECFPEEVMHLSQKNGVLQSSSSVKSLHPFLDEDKVLRVGDRLHNSSLSYQEKHPMLLPAKHRLTQLVLQEEHRRLMHSPPKMLLSSIRRKFWPINGPTIAKKILNQCLKCTIVNCRSCKQITAPLPASRVNFTKPFTVVGVDYTGFIPVIRSSRKNAKREKAYVIIFICFSTKAVHPELVSDLFTDTFLSAFKRFSSRRGFPSELVSDNAKTFVGTSNVFKSYLEYVCEDSDVAHYLAEHNVTWKFNPPSSPHHGGLWESAVRNFKGYLHKASGARVLHETDLMTFIVLIEGVMNSRPLVPLSSSPDDLEALTPGHFLIGRPLTSIPPSIHSPAASRSLGLQPLHQELNKNFLRFWQRWQREYLQQLQRSAKWHKKTVNLDVGSLVIVKDKCSPPMFWRLARVMKTHPGPDGLVPVVTVRTSTSTLTRAITELCLLPVGSSNEESGPATNTLSQTS